LNIETKEAIFFVPSSNIEEGKTNTNKEKLKEIVRKENIDISEITIQNNFQETATIVSEWFKIPVEAFVKNYLNKSFEKFTLGEKNKSLSKLALNYFALENEENITLIPISTAISNQDFFYHILKLKLDLLYKKCVEDKNIFLFPELVNNEIPKRCFSQKTYEAISKLCLPITFKKDDNFNEYNRKLNNAFKTELTIAVVAYLSKAKNQRADILSSVILEFWKLRENKRLPIDENYFLNKEIAKKLLPFTSLWNAIFLRDKSDFKLKLNLSKKMFGYYGYGGEYNRSLESGEILQLNYDKSNIQIRDDFVSNTIKTSFKDIKRDNLNYKESISLGVRIFTIFKSIYIFTRDIDFSFNKLLHLVSTEIQENDVATLVAVYKSVEYLNLLQEIGKSKQLFLKHKKNINLLKPYEFISYNIELGNLFRYLGTIGDSKKALNF